MPDKNHASSENQAFVVRRYGRTKNTMRCDQNENYSRAKLRNWTTGRSQEIVLIDWNELERHLGAPQTKRHTYYEQFRDVAVAHLPPPELKKDVRDALRFFSPIELRILFRVIVQGQSFEQATARMRQSAQSWRDWFNQKAAPLLRAHLADYADMYRPQTRREVA